MCPVVDASGTIGGIAALRARLGVAARQIAQQGALLIEATGKRLTHVQSGTLRRSWKIDGPEGGDGVYRVGVGPTMIYARRQELGFQNMTDSLGRLFTNDPGWPYVRPAHLEAISPLQDLAMRLVTEAVRG